MAVNLVSPGISIREVDLTRGLGNISNEQVAAFAGPFEKGPVGVPVLIQSEKQLLSVFGNPRTEGGQNSYWLHASNYLSYGGSLQIVRCNSTGTNDMKNAWAGIGSTATVRIKSVEDYNNQTPTNYYYAAKNPGSWGNGLAVYTIDGAADQTVYGTINKDDVWTYVGVATISKTVGIGVSILTGINTTGIQTGMVVRNPSIIYSTEEIIPQVGTSLRTLSDTDITTPPYNLADVTTVVSIGSSRVTLSNTTIRSSSSIQFTFGTYSITEVIGEANIKVGQGVRVNISNRTYAGIGETAKFTGYLKGIITGTGSSSFNVKLISRTDTAATPDVTEFIEYSKNSPINSIQSSDTIYVYDSTINTNVAIATFTAAEQDIKDWYDDQTITINGSTTYWESIAPKPGTSEYVRSNGGANDEINIIVVDTDGKISGNPGEILEKFTKLSKAKDGIITPTQSTYYRDYLRDNSNYIFAGVQPPVANSTFASATGYSTYIGGSWNSTSVNTYFDVSGNDSYDLSYGTDYVGGAINFTPTLSDLTTAYSAFESRAQYPINYIISGPSAGTDIYQSQAKANYIISLAESRKDCVAVISALENDVVNQTNSNTQTNNIIKFFNGVSASTYAVFDSGYKYTYDRFNSKFLYLACNSDIAGLMARTALNQYPWYSPAGSVRGVISNAIKLAYNPSNSQRDLLYVNRINPIIATSGQGIMLYGDKTASGYQSAFDRINVRNLFLTIEKTIEEASRAQLFEFNDSITRTNFINVVEPYLRDVKAKRGISEFLVICDESNNTPDIIDSNQFKADIYVKPARSINFIPLTFIATRTGVQFSEIVGTV